jgi:ubiquinone/menaquinone biosynthesis C-methylase UbiE
MDADKVFSGSIPALYDRYLGPALFVPYAADLATRAAALAPARLLEIAAGTGIVTRALAAALPSTAIVATDLNQAMIDHAATQTDASNVTFRQADAQALPFDEGAFDVVVCQFGVMFFPDKPRAFAEARRVVRDGGSYLFSVWDDLEHNDLGRLVTEALAARFPDDPPRFLARTPYGHGDGDAIARLLSAAGWRDVSWDRVALPGPTTAEEGAVGYCQGCPLAGEIEARAPGRLADVTAAVADDLARRIGSGRVDLSMRARVFQARR